MIINVIGPPLTRILFSVPLVSGVVSGTFQPVLVRYGLFCDIPFFLQQRHIMFCIARNELYVDFIIKDCKRHYKVGQLKVWQVLQIGARITKRVNIYVKLGQ